jgi:hypothetical protein
MALPSTPPRGLVYSVSLGDTGWPVYAAQCALDSIRFATKETWPNLTPDGDFGQFTDEAARAFQLKYGLTVDGKLGPASARKLVELLDHRVHTLLPAVPDGLIRGMAEGEGGDILAAVNWSIPGGVDCGIMQYRVYGPPYDLEAMRSAFNPVQAMLRAGTDFLARTEAFTAYAAVRNHAKPQEFAKRLAVLAHNWPAGALDLAKDGLLSRPNDLATWVPSGAKFPDGTAVKTRLQWAQFYALGGIHGEAVIAKYVKEW